MIPLSPPAAPSRRSAFAVPVALAAAPVALASAAELTPDAWLIGLCDQIHALAAEAQRNEACAVPHAAVEDWCKRWTEALGTLADLTPCTTAGLRAKAAATAVALRHGLRVLLDLSIEEQAGSHEWLALRLAEDMAARL